MSPSWTPDHRVRHRDPHPGATFTTIKNSNIHHNSDHGMLGGGTNSSSKAQFRATTGSGFNHGSPGRTRDACRPSQQRTANNSVVDGTCTGESQSTVSGMACSSRETPSFGGVRTRLLRRQSPLHTTPESTSSTSYSWKHYRESGACAICASAAPDRRREQRHLQRSGDLQRGRLDPPSRVVPATTQTAPPSCATTPSTGRTQAPRDPVSRSGPSLARVMWWSRTSSTTAPPAAPASSTQTPRTTRPLRTICAPGRCGVRRMPRSQWRKRGFDEGGVNAEPRFRSAPTRENDWNAALCLIARRSMRVIRR